MSRDSHPFDEQLLADHLDQLTDGERAELSEAMRGDPALLERHRRLGRVLAPLDRWNAPAAPGRLVDDILDRVAAAGPPPGVVRRGDLPEGERRRSPLRMIPMRDLLGLAAVIAFLLIIMLPGLSEMRARSQRVACATNLRSIGAGLGSYALAQAGALPFAGNVSGGRWLRSGTSGVPYAPNSRSRYLLLRFQYVGDAAAFVCPSRSDAVPLKLANPHALEDFPDPRHCSYDSLNMAGPTPAFARNCDVPYMADANPLFDGGVFKPMDARFANSTNHRGGAGQNVLCVGGDVRWAATPNCGLNGDNIWQAGSVTVYTGTEVQSSSRDAFLVP